MTPPPGTFLCLDPTCDVLLPDELLDGDWYACPRGHTVELRDREQQLSLSVGGWTHVGLTCTEQGYIAEQVVRDLGHLGNYGRISWWSDRYNEPLDGATDEGWGIEVKSVSTRARNFAYFPGTRAAKRRKDAFARERGWRGILAVLVVLDFAASTAAVHVRPMRRMRYFEDMGDPIARVPFPNPFEEAA